MTAQIFAFPSARDVKMVAVIVREMRACGSADGAERVLINHLEICWDRLEAIGVDCDEIERECRAFAIAAWAGFQQKTAQNSPGAA